MGVMEWILVNILQNLSGTMVGLPEEAEGVLK